MRTDFYRFLKECALERKSIKEMCKERGVNPFSVWRFMWRNYKREGSPVRRRIVRKGRGYGFRYDGVVVFWDRVEEEGKGEGKGKSEEIAYGSDT